MPPPESQRFSDYAAHAPDPDLARAGLERLAPHPQMERLLDSPADLVGLATITGASPFLTDQMDRHPDWIDWLFPGGALHSSKGPDPPPHDPARVGTVPSDAWLEALNRYKRRELLRIGARALLNLSSQEEEFSDLSSLADGILETLVGATSRNGEPRPSVIALGKLGGNELNFSSDVDLMFTVSLTEDRPLAASLPPVTRSVENLIEALSRYTPEGALYRVDLRLRPGGDRAPLVRTLTGMENYYSGRGAPWERQMLVKARVCAGDLQAGQDLLSRLTPFIYPTHAQSDPREEAHRLRRERRAREGGAVDTRNVKLAPGGIRDVEFVIQVLQLLFGGKRPQVRTPSTLEGLERLREAGIVPAPEAEQLASAYRFFRRLEHLLQMEEDRQTFRLPSEGPRCAALARLMGSNKCAALLTALDAHREMVEAILHGLLPASGEEVDGEPLEELLNLPLGGEEAAARLAARGFSDPAQSHRVLVAAGSHARSSGAAGWAAFVGLLPLLLKDAAATGAADRALNNLERILRRLGSPGAYVRMLAREEGLRRALLCLCASGELLTQMLLRHPEHFERMFSTTAAAVAADRAGWRQRIRRERRTAARGADLAHRLETLKTRETLAIGLMYAIGDRELGPTMLSLGRLASDLVSLFLGSHFQEYQRPPRSGVVALGTLSAGHMTFASDADLLFVHLPDAASSIQELCARVSGLLSPPGGPYSVDMRLRPEGRSAPASVDVGYFTDYLQGRASSWEALALFRAAPLYGRRCVLHEPMVRLEEWLGTFRLDDGTRSSLREVRERQAASLLEEGLPAGWYDVKRSPGSMGDIEFLALGLRLDSWKPPEPRTSHIPALLVELAERGELERPEARLLHDHYLRLRAAQIGLQLHQGRDVTRLPPAWSDPVPSPSLLPDAADDLIEDSLRVRGIFDRVFPASGSLP